MTRVRVLGADEIGDRLRSELPGWEYEDGAIGREFRTDGWPTTVLLVNAIGFFAEAADHHPDLEVGFNRLVVRFVTHHAGGVTDKDFAMARQVEAIASWRPPAESGLTGARRELVRGT